MTKKVIQYYQRKKTLVNYSLFGSAAFVISFISFAALEGLTDMDWAQANIIAWILATIFSYFTNRAYVFNSDHDRFLTEILEMTRFFLGRGFTLVSEQILLWVGIRLLGMESLIIKLIAQILVVVLNYIISKFLVFKRKNQTDPSKK